MARNVTAFPVWFYDHFKDEEKRQRVLEPLVRGYKVT